MAKTELERVGVSLDKPLLEEFDRLIRAKGYANRSEAVRDLIRAKLSETELESQEAAAIGTVFLVYDHHQARVPEQLTAMQHTHLLTVVTSVHVHLDHHNCLELIVLKGKVGQIQQLADRMISLKGVKLGRLVLCPVAEHPGGQ